MTFQTEKLSYIDNKNSIEQNIALISQLNAADLLTVWKQYAANELKTLETNKASQFCELSKQVVAQFRRTKRTIKLIHCCYFGFHSLRMLYNFNL